MLHSLLPQTREIVFGWKENLTATGNMVSTTIANRTLLHNSAKSIFPMSPLYHYSSGWFPRSFLEPKISRPGMSSSNNSTPSSRRAPAPGSARPAAHESMMRPGPGQFRVGNHY